MVNMTQNEEFYGKVVSRVLILRPEGTPNINVNGRAFIENKFNTLRNYRDFSNDHPVKIIEKTSDKLPHMNIFKEGDACLLIGSGRFIDKASFAFVERCFEIGIPVYFIRSNSIDTDSRVVNPLWKTHSLTIKTAIGYKHLAVPPKYFMEIPRIADLVVLNESKQLYALIPGMVATL